MSTKILVEKLEKLLADNYALYLKTQNYHWNVQGSYFPVLHAMFESQYKDLATAIDTIAELIRGLGAKAPATFKEYMEKTSIIDGVVHFGSDEMLRDLLKDQSIITKSLEAALATAKRADDEVVVNFIAERMTIHRKNTWMLSSTIV